MEGTLSLSAVCLGQASEDAFDLAALQETGGQMRAG